MATIPTFQKKERLQGQGFPIVPFSAAQAGAATTRAFGTLADVAGNVADLFAAREIQRKGENDKIHVSNLYYGPGGFKDQIRKVSTDARATVGKDSENIGNEFITSYDKLGEDTLNGDAVENDEQRVLLQGLIFKGRSGAINPVAKHQASQHQLRKKAAQEQVIVDATMSVADDPETLSDSLVDLRLALEGQPERLEKESAALKKIADEAALKNLSDAVWTLAMPLDLETGEAIIKASDLPRENKKKMLKDYRDEKTIQQKRAEDELKQAQNATANEFDQKLDTLSIAEVETSNLDPGTSWGKKDYYRDKIADRADKIEKDKVDPFTEFDPATKSDLQKRANTAPEGLSNDEIWGAVGKGEDGGITAAQAQQIQIRRDANLAKPDTGRRNGQAHDIIDGLETNDIFNADDEAQNIFDAQRWRDALDKFIEENPDEDPVKWTMENIKTPAETGWLQNIMDFLIINPGKAILGATEPNVSKKLTRQQAQAFRDQADGDLGKARQLAKEAGFEF